MIFPAALIFVSPIMKGVMFGPVIIEGLLVGIIVSGLKVALSASNTGNAWVNA